MFSDFCDYVTITNQGTHSETEKKHKYHLLNGKQVDIYQSFPERLTDDAPQYVEH